MNTDLFDSILDTSLDDVADLPEYADYLPTGHYKLLIADCEKKVVETTNKETKQKEGSPVVQVTYEVVEVLELKDSTEEPLVKPGMRFSESYWLNGDSEKKKKTLEIIKARYKELSEQFKWTNVAEIVAGLKGLTITAAIRSVPDKNDKGRFYIQTKNLQAL
jgi:hypothetical protein